MGIVTEVGTQTLSRLINFSPLICNSYKCKDDKYLEASVS